MKKGSIRRNLHLKIIHNFHAKICQIHKHRVLDLIQDNVMNPVYNRTLLPRIMGVEINENRKRNKIRF